jgi:hypothetical protein
VPYGNKAREPCRGYVPGGYRTFFMYARWILKLVPGKITFEVAKMMYM